MFTVHSTAGLAINWRSIELGEVNCFEALVKLNFAIVDTTSPRNT